MTMETPVPPPELALSAPGSPTEGSPVAAAAPAGATAPTEREVSPPFGAKTPFYAQAPTPSITLRGILLRWIALAAIGVAAVAGVNYLLSTFPPLPACEGVTLRTVLAGAAPKLVGGGGDVMGTAKQLWRCADAAQRHAPETTLAIFVATYCGLQAFAIPGPLVLSIVAGALYGATRAQLVIAGCATAGATLCYLLSALIARPLIERQFPARLADLRARVDAHRESSSLVSYLLFLRLTPAVPNWFINAASPIVGVPLHLFVGTTALGLVPPNYFHATAGAALAALAAEGGGDVPSGDNWRQFGILLLLQVAVLLPLLILRRRLTAAVQVATVGKTS